MKAFLLGVVELLLVMLVCLIGVLLSGLGLLINWFYGGVDSRNGLQRRLVFSRFPENSTIDIVLDWIDVVLLFKEFGEPIYKQLGGYISAVFGWFIGAVVACDD